ncbi:MAG: antitoxin family protein [Acidobacteriota bacterium]|nr:antitoxin family protein [Acidobacteriota bacterium]
MTKTLEATYDGETLRPDEPLDLKPNTRVRLTIVVPESSRDVSRGSLRELFGSVDLGYPTGADNESIDRDLAREYAATHEDEG